jgi:hypothetical protein
MFEPSEFARSRGIRAGELSQGAPALESMTGSGNEAKGNPSVRSGAGPQIRRANLSAGRPDGGNGVRFVERLFFRVQEG